MDDYEKELELDREGNGVLVWVLICAVLWIASVAWLCV